MLAVKVNELQISHLLKVTKFAAALAYFLGSFQQSQLTLSQRIFLLVTTDNFDRKYRVIVAPDALWKTSLVLSVRDFMQNYYMDFARVNTQVFVPLMRNKFARSKREFSLS